MKRHARLGRIIIAGVILAAVGGIVAVGLSLDDGKPGVQALSPERAEAVRQVARNRGIIARYQNLARGRYETGEYVRVQFTLEWEAIAGLPKSRRDVEYRQLQDRARREIQQRREIFDRALANYQAGNSPAALNALRRAAEDNLDFGLRMALLSLSRQESALRARKIKFSAAGIPNEAEEQAIKKQENACLTKKAELNLVQNNRNSVIALIVRQAGRQAD